MLKNTTKTNLVAVNMLLNAFIQFLIPRLCPVSDKSKTRRELSTPHLMPCLTFTESLAD